MLKAGFIPAMRPRAMRSSPTLSSVRSRPFPAIKARDSGQARLYMRRHVADWKKEFAKAARSIDEPVGRSLTSDLPMEPARLDIEKLSLFFGGLKAINSVSFGVEPGSITAMIGRTGPTRRRCSTAFRSSTSHSRGRRASTGRTITRAHPPERARMGFARTFQNIALFREMTVLDNIKLGRHAHMAQVSHIRRFHLLTNELHHSDDEVTATMKVRRANIQKKYAAEIDSLYAAA